MAYALLVTVPAVAYAVPVTVAVGTTFAIGTKAKKAFSL